MPRRPAVAHVRINGATTRTPAASPSVQVRNTCPSSSAEITSPSRSDNGPNAALTTAATSAQATQGEHVGDPIQPAAPAREAAQEQRGDHERDGVPERLGEHRPERRRVVAEEQIADHDRGPQADAVEEQHGEAETGRRPQRRHRAVEVGQLEADATGAVVRERHDRDRDHIEHRPRVLSAAQGIDLLPHRVAARAESAEGRCAHGLNAESPTSRTTETPARFRGPEKGSPTQHNHPEGLSPACLTRTISSLGASHTQRARTLSPGRVES